MNENIFDVLYTLAQENGYTKSSDEFIALLQDNPDARKTMYDISLSEGFTKSLGEFEDLVKIDKKKIRSRLEERQKQLDLGLASASEAIFSESPEYLKTKERFDSGNFTLEEKEAFQEYSQTGELNKSLLPKKKDVDDSENPITKSISFAIDEAYTNEEISEILDIQFGEEFTLNDKDIERLATLNKRLLTAPKSESRKAYDEAFESALSDNNKKLLENPYGDLDRIKERFDKGLFSENEKTAYNHYRDTGEIDEAKLPKKELTFLDDLGAFYEAINKAGISKSALALTEISISSQLGMIMSDPARQAGLVGAFTGLTVGGAASGGTLAAKAALAGFFGASSAVYDSTLRFNGFINEVLEEKNLPIDKSSYKKLLEDKDMIASLRLKAVKGGLSVGIIDGLTMMLTSSVGSAGGRMLRQAKGRVARAATSAGTVAATTGVEMTGGGLGERVAQIASDEPYSGRDIIEEAFAEGPIGGASGVMNILRSSAKSYKINGKNVSEEAMNDIVRVGSPEELKAIDLSIKNDNTLSKIYSDKIKTDSPVEKTPEVTTEKEASEGVLGFAPRNITLVKPVKDGDNEVLTGRDAELEAEVIERKLNKFKEKGESPRRAVTILQSRLSLEQNNAEFFADYIENFLSGKVTTPFSKWRKGRPDTIVEDIEISDLEQTLIEQGVQFQLSTDVTSEEKKAELLNIAMNQIKEAEISDVSEDVYEANKVDVEKAKIDYSGQPLSKGVPQVNSDVLIDKMINLVMADQLMVGEIETSSGKKLKRMGGVFFSLIPELKDKIAWASIDLKSARDIVRGAIKADETVVFNMKPTAIDSNVALVEYAFQQIKGKSKNEANLFKDFKKYFSTLKVGDKLKKAINDSKDFNEVLQKFPGLSTNNRARLVDILLPTESVENTIPYKKQLVELGITAESARDANIEESIKDAPMGAMLSIIEVTDENGNKITDPADIDKAIVPREQAIKEGLPIHENYPFYIRGKHKALINETTPFWNYMPKALEKIDLKIAEVIKQKSENKETGAVTERRLSSKEARSAEQRAATMSAATAKKAVGPDVTQYEKFVNMISKSIPGINVVTDEKGFSEFRDDIYSRKMVTKTQKVYGAVRGNTLYLNPDLQNFNTPIHELGHLWTNTVKELQLELYNKGISLVKNSIYEKKVLASEGYKKVVKEMKSNGFSDTEINNYILEEALATAIGDKGESYVKASTMQKFRSWLQNLYDFIKTKLGISQFSAEDIENMNLDQFTEAVAVDILKGEPLFEESQVKTIDELQLQTSDADIYEIIRVARNNGFPDSAIEKFLLKRGFKKKQIAEAKKINVNALQELPASFYNAGRTALDGLALFEKAFDYAKKRVKKFGSEKAIDLTTNNLIIKSPVFKNSDDIVKEEMIRDFGKFMGKKFKSSPNPERVLMGIGRAVLVPKERSTRMAEDRRKYYAMLRNFNVGAKNLLQLQREIRNFIRKYIPRADYKKAEVNKLIKIVTDAKTDTDVSSAIRQVEDIIISMHNKELTRKVNNLKDYKGTRKQSKKAVGTISPEAQDRLAFINEYIDKNDQALITDKLREDVSPQEINDLLVALDYLASQELIDTDFAKMQSLSELESDFRSIINDGRNQRAEKKQKEADQRAKRKKVGLDEIYGFDVDVNNLDDITVAVQQKQKAQSKSDKWLQKFLKGIDYNRARTFSDMTDVMDILSRAPGEMIGGKLEEMTTMRLKEAENTYKQGKMQINEFEISPKLKQIFGKNWKSKMRTHGSKTFTGIIGEKGVELELSQSQAYYIYNQAKDPANNKSFEKKYGENYREILDQIEKYLKPEVKQWADYQTDVLFPMLYDRYNDVYRKVYDTNLPWNNKYAGRIYREGSNVEVLQMMDKDQKSTSYRNSVAGASTKERVKTSTPIKDYDGNQALSNYIYEMEQFRAYAEAISEVDALFKDADIQKAIERTSGKGMVRIVNEMISIIANRGKLNEMHSNYINIGIDFFIGSKLGLNPIIAIKQLTSIPAYTSDIGLKNWTKYSPKALSNFSSIWKEITDNSIYIKDRYNNSIQNALTASKADTVDQLVPNKLKSGADSYIKLMMKLIKYGDMGGVSGGLPNYLYYKDQFKSKNPNATEQEVIDYAIKKFEYDTSKAQQSYDLTDRDLLQAMAYMRAFNMFTTTPRQYLRKQNQAFRQIRRYLQGKSAKRTLGRNVYQYSLYRFALPLIFQYVSIGLPGLFREMDKEDKDDLLRAIILGNFNAIFVFGSVLEMGLNYAFDKPWKRRVEGLPIMEAVQPAIESWDKYIKNTKEEKERDLLFKALFNSLAIAGMPNTAYKYADFFADLSERDMDTQEFIYRMVGFSEYQARKGL